MALEMGMDLDRTIDILLTREVLSLRLSRWNADNVDAVNEYNARIAQKGTLAQRIRDQAGPESTL